MQTGLIARLWGTVQDDPNFGIPDIASIKGWVFGSRIVFWKQYPAFHVFDPAGRMTLRELLKRQGHHLDYDILPGPIRYTGRYDPMRDCLEGDWVIAARTIQISIAGKWHRMDCPATTGTWTAQR